MSHNEKSSRQPATPQPAGASTTTMSFVKAESDSETNTVDGQQEKAADTSSHNIASTKNVKQDSNCEEASSDGISHDKSRRQDSSSAEPFEDTAVQEDEQQAGLRDTSGIDSPTLDSKPSSVTTSDRNRSFPVKLMKILDSEEYKDIFAWTKSGKSFSIYKPYELISKILVVHFDGKCDMKFDSFLRKLYRWGFTKRSSSDEIDGEGDGGQVYYHENFQRGNYKLCSLMNCNSKPTTNRPLVKGNGSMHHYNPYYAHGMLNVPSNDFGIDPIQMQMQLQQQQYLTRLYQQQQLQNLSGQSSFQYPYGQTSQGFLTRQRQEQEMMLLHQQQLHLANLAQQAHPSSQYPTMSGLHPVAPRSFGYPPNSNLNAPMYNFPQPTLGNSAFVKMQNDAQATNSQPNQRATNGQLLENSNHQVDSGSQVKSDIRHEKQPGATINDEAMPEETAKRKGDFQDAQKDKVQRVASHKDGDDNALEEER